MFRLRHLTAAVIPIIDQMSSSLTCKPQEIIPWDTFRVLLLGTFQASMVSRILGRGVVQVFARHHRGVWDTVAVRQVIWGAVGAVMLEAEEAVIAEAVEGATAEEEEAVMVEQAEGVEAMDIVDGLARSLEKCLHTYTFMSRSVPSDFASFDGPRISGRVGPVKQSA